MARITVIDDYPDFLQVMDELLGDEGGHEVQGFDGNATTFEQIVASTPELLVIDLRLGSGGLSGWDILTMSRADDRLRGLPIIVSSADLPQMRTRAEEFERLGNVHPLEKPFGAEELLQLVDRLL